MHEYPVAPLINMFPNTSATFDPANLLIGFELGGLNYVSPTGKRIEFVTSQVMFIDGPWAHIQPIQGVLLPKCFHPSYTHNMKCRIYSQAQ
jgi:hypothetical protein